MRVDARTSAMSRAGHDLADEQDLRVAVEREAEAIDLVVGLDHALRDRRSRRAQARRSDLAQAMADEVRDLDQPLFQEAGLDLCHAPSRTGRRRTRP